MFFHTAAVPTSSPRLSPSINNPLTAYAYIDRLAEGSIIVLKQPEAANYFTDATGELRLISNKFEFIHLLSASLDEVVEHGRVSGVFIRHLLVSKEE
ncbi:DUF2254 domain-containing protein [Microbulbifer sp. OS29]|uniref:DUF2254 domain-containing protein n=1 Tax=Microbulbifer okhotskensis TaxID=2926617 RepID=A0A9X2EQM0_9GAMM|nr:DUF2254 family protein [Microbulbifer okhotskensis]MCO1335540.1 DUF2254 domain-containing protein [Microbulbifer okhotskensis]